jgi:hypothetical protein
LDIIRVAAQAALMIVDKYSLFTNDCDIYQFAIGIFVFFYLLIDKSDIYLVLCPDWKLKWFKDHGFSAAEIKDIKKRILARFSELMQQMKFHNYCCSPCGKSYFLCIF